MAEIRNQVAESGFIEKNILADYLFKSKAIPNEHHNQILRLLEVLEVVIEDRKGRYFIPGFAHKKRNKLDSTQVRER